MNPDPVLEALHRTLDANPDDHFTRSVLADAVQERGDEELAVGLRALVREGKRPVYWGSTEEWDWHAENAAASVSRLDSVWFSETQRSTGCRSLYHPTLATFGYRREAEESAARAWVRVYGAVAVG